MKKYTPILLGCFIIFFIYSFQYKKYLGRNKEILKRIDLLDVNFNEITLPNSGTKVLPFETQVLLYALDTLKIKTYKTHGNFSRTGNLGQSFYYFMGSSWPRYLDTTSMYVIGRTSEISTISGIKIIFNYENVGVGLRN